MILSVFYSFRQGGDTCFILKSLTHRQYVTAETREQDRPWWTAWCPTAPSPSARWSRPPTDAAGILQPLQTKTRDSLKLESLMLLGLVKLRVILHRELKLTPRDKKLNLIRFPFSRLYSFSAVTENSVSTPPTVSAYICICSTLKHFHCRKDLIFNYVSVKLKHRVVFQCFYFNHF